MNWNGDPMSTHQHDQTDHDEQYSQASWDARYSESARIWSGNPNPRLVEHITGMTPGTALDVGAGEGADAVWLATQGWLVTALDVSEVALGKAVIHAVEQGVGERVTTVHHDLMSGADLPGTYDLVSAQFWHPPAAERAEHFRRIGAAVRPGGALLIVGHHPDDLSTGLRSGHGHAERVFTPDLVVAALPESEWDVRVADAPTRETQHGGEAVMLTDTVVLAIRR
jgi:SAM-dependent methyltransferase